MNQTISLSRKISLFDGLNQKLLDELDSLIHVKDFCKKEYVVHKGERGEYMLFLLEGRLIVMDENADGRQTGLNFIEPGEFLGELAVIDELPRSASVMSIAQSKVAMLSRVHARKLIFNHPLIAERMLKHLALKVRATTDYRALLGIPNAFQRIFRLIGLLGKPDPGKLITIENMPTHEQIALMANTSRETVTRAIQFLNDEKVIEKDNRRLIIRFPEKLHFITNQVVREQTKS